MRSRFWMAVLAAAGCGLSGVLSCSLLYSADAISGAPSDASSDAPSDASEAAPSPEGGTDAPTPCDPSFVFCEGFEHGLDAWTPDTKNGGTVTTDSTHAYRGAYALHTFLPGHTVDLHAAIKYKQPWGSPVYVRFFVYLTSPLHPAYMSLLFFTEPAPSGAALALATNGPPGDNLTFDSLAADGGGSGALSSIPLDTWVCLEVAIDGTSGSLWMNGSAKPLATVGFVAPTDTVTLGLGPHVGGSTIDAAYDAWFDDVAVSHQAIGCAR
jgi:hypothetical protein